VVNAPAEVVEPELVAIELELVPEPVEVVATVPVDEEAVEDELVPVGFEMVELEGPVLVELADELLVEAVYVELVDTHEVENVTEELVEPEL
jgi:hypothetical protein